MSVTVKVNGSSNSLVHKGSNGIASSTIPDVCKTPSPGGPVPIPYPVIVSMSSDLDKGSTTVKADGGNMIAIKDSEFSKCTGDEAGTAGGVTSSTFGKEAKFILYSFDVKIDGANACRLADKMTMNHQNTMCLGGVVQLPIIVQNVEDIACKCAKATTFKQIYPPGHEKEWLNCAILGSARHKCVADELRPPNGDPEKSGVHPGGGANYQSGAMPDGQAYCRPDIIVTSPGVSSIAIPAPKMEAILELKFPCNKDGKSFGSSDPEKMLSRAQRNCYEKIKLNGGVQKPGGGVDVIAIGPNDENCK